MLHCLDGSELFTTDSRNPSSGSFAGSTADKTESFACFGSVNLQSGKFVHSFFPVFNAAKFKGFVRLLPRHRLSNRKMVVILDNARYLHARLLKLCSCHPTSSNFRWLRGPRNSQHRLATHNLYFSSLDELFVAVEICFVQWRKPSRILQRLFGIS